MNSPMNSPMNCVELFRLLKNELRRVAEQHQLTNQSVSIHCRQLTAKEAIGEPEHRDYPIIKGKEVMVEADFMGAKGQAFTDEYEKRTYTIREILTLDLSSNNATRASFIAAFNAVMRSLDLAEKTIHCKDAEPVRCAKQLIENWSADTKVLLVGYQPRFLEYLASKFLVRVVDMDPEHVNQIRFGIKVEPVSATDEAIAWCDQVLATGSTVVNGTLVRFFDCGKPVTFYGTTIAATAPLLGLATYCHCGH